MKHALATISALVWALIPSLPLLAPANPHLAVVAKKKAPGGTTTGYLGYSDPTGSTGPANGGAASRERMFKVTAANAGTLTRMRLYTEDLSTSRRVRMFVWNDNAGDRGTLKASTTQTGDTIAKSSPAWTPYYDLTAEGGEDLDVSASEVIWIGFMAQNANTDFYYFLGTSGDAEYSDAGTWNTATTGAGTDSASLIVMELEYEY